MSEWISVKDKKPEINETVLMVVSCGGSTDQVFCGFLSKSEKYYSHEESDPTYDYSVTHWMPLPEPPKA